MVPPNDKHKTDNWYEPDKWETTLSEKRFFAIRPTVPPHMSSKDKKKTTNIMSAEEVEKIQEEYEEDSSLQFEFLGDGETPNPDEAPMYHITKKKVSDSSNVFDKVEDQSKNVHLSSNDKSDSDMIALDPKDASRTRKIKVGFRTWRLRLLQWFK